MRGEVPLAALMQEWLAEDTGPDDPDIEGQMRDLDGARHATQSLFRKEPLMPADLDALDALLQAATPGPWIARDMRNRGTLGQGRVDSQTVRNIADCSDPAALTAHGYCGLVDPEECEANAALIAAAVTALPDLLRRVRLGDAAREVLEALEKWRGAAFDAEMRPTLGEREVARADVRLRYDKVAAARARYRALLETPDAS